MSKANKKKNKDKKLLKGTLSNNLKGLLKEGFERIALALQNNKQKKMHVIILACKTNDGSKLESMDAMFVRASPGTMVGMLYSAGQKDINFAKAIITASQGLMFGNSELKDMQSKMEEIEKAVINNVSNDIRIPNEEDVNNMSIDDMDDYIKKMLGGKKSQGEA